MSFWAFVDPDKLLEAMQVPRVIPLESRWNAEVELRVEGAGEGRGDRDGCSSR